MNPSFYAVIPSNVRYAKINPSAKLLYGEITALCSKEGYCFANNYYFSNLYNTTNRTVQRWLKELASINVITISTNEEKRKIFIHDPMTKVSPPHDNNVTHIITRNINTNNKDIYPHFEKFWKAYAYKKGKDGALRVWIRKKLDEKVEEVVTGAIAYTKTRGTNKKYWKHAQGWLNDERWKDEARNTHEWDKPENMIF